MAGITIKDFYEDEDGNIEYTENGVYRSTSDEPHFSLSNADFIKFVKDEYDECIYTEYIEGSDTTFTSPSIEVVNGVVFNLIPLYFVGNTVINGSGIQTSNVISCNGNLTINTSYGLAAVFGPSADIYRLVVSNGYLNVDNTTWQTDEIDVVFGSNAQLQITSSSKGKTLIVANEVSGTITLDVQSGVNEGDTFSIEATTNNLIITDVEWTATPSTVGNVTTYTLAKAGPSKKQRLFYTYENGSKVLRFLRSGL